MGRKTKMNSITSPELLAQVNPDNIALKDEFISYMKSMRRSEGTCKGYDSDLQIFFVWVLQNAKNKEFASISKRDIIAFQNWLVYENENSPARIRRIKAAISSLSNFAENILADEDPKYANYRSIVRKIDNPPLQPVREKTVWEDGELEDLLAKLVEKKKYEQACFVALGMFSGRRKSELARFKVSDFDDSRLVQDGALYESAPSLTKGGRMMECYTLAKKFKPYFDLWMEQREAAGVQSEWLFPDIKDSRNHISNTQINSWTRIFSTLTGRDFYMHSLRHYFVTALSKAGIPDNAVVQIIGWKSAEMFNIYNDQTRAEQIGMFFKDGDICAPEKKSFSDL